MAHHAAPLEVRLARAARRDIVAILNRSKQEFGKDAALRYEALLARALHDIGNNPELPGSKERPELARGIRVYHLSFSRARARTPLGVVHAPRHFVIYRRRKKTTVEVLRILHDSRDLERHLRASLAE